MRAIGRTRRKWGAAGYTFMEVSVGVAITGIMAAISMPNMVETIQRHRADGASRQVMADLRYAQSQAISRGMEGRIVIYSDAGVATGSGNANDAAKANRYRVELRPTGGAWPAVTDTMASNSNVLSEWLDLAHDFNQSVTTPNAVVFTSRGSLQNSASNLNIVLQTRSTGRVRTVRTHLSGLVEIL